MSNPQLKFTVLRYFLKLSRITSSFKNRVTILKIKVWWKSGTRISTNITFKYVQQNFFWQSARNMLSSMNPFKILINKHFLPPSGGSPWPRKVSALQQARVSHHHCNFLLNVSVLRWAFCLLCIISSALVSHSQGCLLDDSDHGRVNTQKAQTASS